MFAEVGRGEVAPPARRSASSLHLDRRSSTTGLDLEVIHDLAYAVHLPGERYGPGLGLRVLDDSGQIHRALTRVDVDAREVRGLVRGELGLDGGGDGRVIDGLARCPAGGRLATDDGTAEHGQQ